MTTCTFAFGVGFFQDLEPAVSESCEITILMPCLNEAETLARFGGPGKFAAAVDASLTSLGALLKDPDKIRALLLGAR